MATQSVDGVKGRLGIEITKHILLVQLFAL